MCIVSSHSIVTSADYNIIIWVYCTIFRCPIMKKKPSANLIVGPNECGASHTLIARIEYYNIPLISNHPALCGDLLCNKHVMFNILLSITTGHSILMLTIATSYYRHAVRCIRNFYFKSSTIIYYIILRFLRLLYSYIFYIPL